MNAFATIEPYARFWALGIARTMAREESAYDMDRRDDELISEIPDKAYDGFFPFTSGGFEASILASANYAYSSGSGPAVAIAQGEADHESMREAYRAQHKAEWDSDLESDDFDLSYRAGAYEDSWRDGDMIHYRARCMFCGPKDRNNETGKPELQFDVYVCLDSHGRDSIPWLRYYGGKSDMTAGDWKVTIPVADLTPAKWLQLKQDAIAAWRAL